VAHLAFFRTEFVETRRWLSESSYADLVALCQLVPGPASSRVGSVPAWQPVWHWGCHGWQVWAPSGVNC
jgi:chromate transporter